MADSKITNLTAETAPLNTDVTVMVDDPGGTPVTKKITLLNLLRGLYTHVSTSSAAATTAANTTPVSVTGAVFTYENNAIYRIWVMGRLNSTAATTGAALHFDVSTAITDINVIGFHQLAAGVSGTLTGFYSITDDTSEGTSSGVPAGPLDVPIFMQAIFRPGNNTGTCQLRIRSETTAVTELMAGATMVVERIA